VACSRSLAATMASQKGTSRERIDQIPSREYPKRGEINMPAPRPSVCFKNWWRFIRSNRCIERINLTKTTPFNQEIKSMYPLLSGHSYHQMTSNREKLNGYPPSGKFCLYFYLYSLPYLSTFIQFIPIQINE
jgi:hypothetical protein